MFFDLNQVEANHFQDKTFDVCVCGAGVAGITLAIQLSKNFSVILLEGGGFEYSKESQALYKGKHTGLEYFDLDVTRLRFFGGSSNSWGGRCRPLDGYDFQKRKDVEFSGWPIDRADLDPYLEETKSILDISEQNTLVAHPPKGPLLSDRKDLQEINFWASPPTRFGHKYRAQINNSTNINCYLNANVTDIRLHNNGDGVKNVVAQNYASEAFEVSAKSFILAFGGIENPRIMLNCNTQQRAGLGNNYDFVGRFFTEHLHFKVGDLILENGVNLGRKRRFFSPTYEFMMRENILNFGLHVKQRIWPKTSFKEKLREIICSSEFLHSSVEGLRDKKVYCEDGLLRIVSEQSPNPNSRIILGSDKDKFGLKSPVLHWQISEIDKHTIRQAVIRFGEAFANSRLGRVRIADWLMSNKVDLPGVAEDQVGGHHHMGTTRMASSPREGVVDANQKVFGINNLYISGSSVFSTVGHANPTFTIVQMSLRLAQHISDTLKNSSLSDSINSIRQGVQCGYEHTELS